MCQVLARLWGCRQGWCWLRSDRSILRTGCRSADGSNFFGKQIQHGVSAPIDGSLFRGYLAHVFLSRGNGQFKEPVCQWCAALFQPYLVIICCHFIFVRLAKVLTIMLTVFTAHSLQSACANCVAQQPVGIQQKVSGAHAVECVGDVTVDFHGIGQVAAL